VFTNAKPLKFICLNYKIYDVLFVGVSNYIVCTNLNYFQASNDILKRSNEVGICAMDAINRISVALKSTEGKLIVPVPVIAEKPIKGLD
jgi:C4-dicarboxylate transporter